jgi:putative oxidoreductase|tara:strand:+ start:1361 stop:1768 length:408 start_codon:yes stop_codon:yes gene_type:complete
MFRRFVNKIPEFCLTHWLLRIPLIVVFLQQGMDKWPIDVEDSPVELTSLVWSVVVLGELGAGVGLLVGGIIALQKYFNELGDMITRFSGITIASIMTGVIWTGEPESFWDVLWYDNLHVLLWVGGMYFALRGNRT